MSLIIIIIIYYLQGKKLCAYYNYYRAIIVAFDWTTDSHTKKMVETALMCEENDTLGDRIDVNLEYQSAKH